MSHLFLSSLLVEPSVPLNDLRKILRGVYFHIIS
jgi:hypothetical protein